MSNNHTKVALVTGGGRGIGGAISIALGENGWIVVVNFRDNEVSANQTVTEIHNRGGRAIAIKADIRDRNQRVQMIDQILKGFGRLDLLVNNAGMAPRVRQDILFTTEESYDEVMAVNLKGPFFLTQYVACKMIELIKDSVIREPKIINIGSISAYASSTTRGEYCLSKAGVGMMTLLFADRLAEYGIQVFEVRPGIIATDMTQAVMSKYDQLISEGLTPIPRHGEPTEVARVVLAIAEGYFPFSTGEVINVDGGFHIRRL